jgi:hypothetical protein
MGLETYLCQIQPIEKFHNTDREIISSVLMLINFPVCYIHNL